MAVKKSEVEYQPTEMVGLILTLFEKNKYCANQIAAVLELLNRRFDEYKNLEPIKFETARGRAHEIICFEKSAIRKSFE